MDNYKAVEAEIQKLQKKAAALRKSEIKSVVAAIRKQIAEYGLTAEELGLGMGGAAKPATRTRAGAGKPVKPVNAGVPKYRDPATQKTWTGRGKPPTWIAGAKNRDAFLIDASARAAAAPSKSKATAAAAPAKAPAEGAAVSGKRARAATGNPSRKKAAATAGQTTGA